MLVILVSKNGVKNQIGTSYDAVTAWHIREATRQKSINTSRILDYAVVAANLTTFRFFAPRQMRQ
jgi:hypothetical protein